MFKRLAAKAKAALLWLQAYTRTDMLYLARGGFWLSFGQVASAALALATTIAFANLFPKESYGAYKYVLSMLGILLIATLPQMSVAVTQAVARGFEATLVKTLKFKLAWGSLGSLASLGAAAYYQAGGNPTLAAAFLIVAVFLPFYSLLAQYDSFLLGRKRFDVSVMYAIVAQAFPALAVIGAVLITKSLAALLVVYFGSRLLINAALFLRVREKFKPNDQDDPGAVSYGKHMTLMGAINTVASSLDAILVYHFLGATQLAIYSIAIGPPEQLKGLIANLDTLIFPNFSKRDSKEIRANMNRKFMSLFAVIFLAVAAYVLAAPFLYGLVFPKYHDSVFYSQIFSLSLLNLTFMPVVTYMRAKRKIKEQYVTNVASSVFQIAVMALFIVKWGLIGLVAARILARCVSMGISLFYYHRTRNDADEATPLSPAAA